MVHSVVTLVFLCHRSPSSCTRPGEKPTPGDVSPNEGYAFVVEGSQPSARIIVDAEKDHLVDIDFVELVGSPTYAG